MNKFLINKSLKNETGAVSVLVIVTILTFLMILLGAYFVTTTLLKSQLESDVKIQEIYGKDINNIDDIYQSLLYKNDTSYPSCNITTPSTEITTLSNVVYNFEFNEDVFNFNIDDISIYNGKVLDTGLSDTLEVKYHEFNTSNKLQLDSSKKYMVSFDYICSSDLNTFNMDLNSDDLPKQTFKAVSTLQHADFIIASNSSSMSECYLRFFDDVEPETNDSIKISNLEFKELLNSSKGTFSKINDRSYTLEVPNTEVCSQTIIVEKNSCTNIYNNGNLRASKTIHIDRNSYISDSLLAYYDGKINAENSHNSESTTWKDLSGNNKNATISGLNFDSTSRWNLDSLLLNSQDENDDVVDIPVSINSNTSFSVQLLYTDYNYSKTGLISTLPGWTAFGASTGFYTQNSENIYDGRLFIGGASDLNNVYRFTYDNTNNFKTLLNKKQCITYTFNATTKTATLYSNNIKVATLVYNSLPEAISSLKINLCQKAFYRISIYNKELSDSEISTNYAIDQSRFNL